jgi:predicted nucleic-acid-binding protein
MANTIKEKQPNTIDKWEVENAVETLIRAEEIKNNRPMFRLASKLMAKKKKALEDLMKESK